MSAKINAQDKEQLASQTDQSPEDNTEQDFPGYPHYPAKDDILNPGNNTERVEVDLENINRSHNSIRLQEKEKIKQSGDVTDPFQNMGIDEDDLGIVEGTEADINADDLLILESDGGEIIPREEDLQATDFLSGINNDLDIPGAELDDENENLGEEDEENNYYSLGGDKEDLL